MKPTPKDGPMLAPTFAMQVRLAADDPDLTEGRLRQGLRDAANVMEAQHELTTLLLKGNARHARHFALLIGAWLALLAFQFANLMGWLR